MNNIYNMHDKSYKTLFSNKDIFLNLIQDFTDEKWKDKITTDSLTLINKSFILSDYEELESDIIYEAKIDGEDVIFYVLLEFQSSIDHSMPIRLLMYMTEIWREKMKGLSKDEVKRKDFKLPAIVPIVTYNGKDKWTVPTQFREKVLSYDLFDNRLLNFEYVLFDVNRFDKNLLIQKESISSAIFLLDQKVNHQEFISRLVTIVKAFDNLSPSEKLELKNWLSRTLDNDIRDAAINILDSQKEEVNKMTANITLTINELKEEAMREGRAEGKAEATLNTTIEIAKNMLLEGLNIELIHSVTKLDLNTISKIKSELNI